MAKNEKKIKPKLSADKKKRLELKKAMNSRRPKFRRQEWFRYKRLGTSWRRPRGLHSKARQGRRYRGKKVSIGFRSPADVRYYHPSGFREVMVWNADDLAGINPKEEAARVGGSVGMRNRLVIQEIAAKKKIRILNPVKAAPSKKEEKEE